MLRKGKLEKKQEGIEIKKVNNFKASNLCIFTFSIVPWEMSENPHPAEGQENSEGA